MTKICIFGAGAIGGYIGARLARAGECDVSLIARGPHLAAMKANGLTLRQGGESFTVYPRLAERGDELGPQDFVIVTTKAQALTGALDAIAPLLDSKTAILFAQNGLPWWYFYKHGGPHDGRCLASVDPAGLIWQRLGPERAIGTVVWQAAELEAPGVVVHGYGDRMPIGEPSGEMTPRVERLSKLLTAAGLKSPVKSKLRNEIWLKLWGNLSFNPVSVLTNGTLADLAGDLGTARVIATMMEEAKAVAESLGVAFSVSVEERVAMAAKVGQHRTSMLQDVEAKRPTEIDALLGSVIELANLQSMVTPTLQIVYDLARFRAVHKPRTPD